MQLRVVANGYEWLWPTGMKGQSIGKYYEEIEDKLKSRLAHTFLALFLLCYPHFGTLLLNLFGGGWWIYVKISSAYSRYFWMEALSWVPVRRLDDGRKPGNRFSHWFYFLLVGS